ncbi:hypothetical protein IT157_02315 [bacterium]|nr:hypothetical protein [bacterium]
MKPLSKTQQAKRFSLPLPPELAQRLSRVKLLLMDVDGVLTDGSILFSDSNGESKPFSTRDGYLLAEIGHFGLVTGVISGRRSPATEARCKSLKIAEIHLGHLNKLPVAQEVITRRGLLPDEVAFIGDDVIDLPVMDFVGFCAAPSDSHSAVLHSVDLVLSASGGRGAVREFLDCWLLATGQWEALIERIFQNGHE